MVRANIAKTAMARAHSAGMTGRCLQARLGNTGASTNVRASAVLATESGADEDERQRAERLGRRQARPQHWTALPRTLFPLKLPTSIHVDVVTRRDPTAQRPSVSSAAPPVKPCFSPVSSHGFESAAGADTRPRLRVCSIGSMAADVSPSVRWMSDGVDNPVLAASPDARLLAVALHARCCTPRFTGSGARSPSSTPRTTLLRDALCRGCGHLASCAAVIRLQSGNEEHFCFARYGQQFDGFSFVYNLSRLRRFFRPDDFRFEDA